MLTTLAALAALLAAQQQTDTTIPVRPGARLEVGTVAGDVSVTTWSRNAVRITASRSSREGVDIAASDQLVRVKAQGRHGAAESVDFDITVPAWMPISISAVDGDIKVSGAQNEVTAETVQGDVTLLGGSGNISLRSVHGSVTLEKASGRIDLHSVNDDVKATDVSGDLSVETVNGDVKLRGIQSSNTEATTVNGDVTYDGTIKDGGRYVFSTHDGDVRVAVPERANVTVSVSTFNGDFTACFPVQVTGKAGHRFSFTIGSGSARLELESFTGDITLCRPGHLDNDNEEE